MKPSKTIISCLAALAAVLLSPALAGAHTEADLVAVPAGSEATITLKPTHGCGDSPTTEVSIQAPVAGASGGEVDGWTVASEDDGDNTVVTWSGGSLPADATGEFPITFTAPDTPGELLLFPAIQVCENGEELEWISGDPTSDYPAPRVLVLAADGVPATSIDDLPADAPGRELLVEIIDIDIDGAGSEAPGEEGGAGEEDPGDTVAPEEPSQTTVAPENDGEAAPGDDDSSLTPILIGLVIVGVVLGIAASVLAKRRSDAEAVDDVDTVDTVDDPQQEDRPNG